MKIWFSFWFSCESIILSESIALCLIWLRVPFHVDLVFGEYTFFRDTVKNTVGSAGAIESLVALPLRSLTVQQEQGNSNVLCDWPWTINNENVIFF